jgi:hypothetical protein
MLSAVWVNSSRDWYERGLQVLERPQRVGASAALSEDITSLP